MSRYVRMMLRQAVYAASSQLLNEVIGMLEQLRTRIEHYQETLHIWNNEFEGYFEEKKTLLLQSEWARKFLLENVNLRDVDNEQCILEHLNQKDIEIIPDRSGAYQQIVGTMARNLEENIFSAVIKDGNKTKKELRSQCSNRFEKIKNSSIASSIILKNRYSTIDAKLSEAGIMLNLQNLNSGTGHIADLCHRKWIALYRGSMSDPSLQELKRHLPADYRLVYCLDEPYRIIFAEELGVYPIRCISLVEDYKKAYDDFDLVDRKRRDSDTRYVFRDLLPPHPLLPKIYQRSEKIIPLARYLGILQEREDPETHFPAIFLAVAEEDTGIHMLKKIALTWEEIKDALANQQILKDIDHQFTGETYLEKIETGVENTLISLRTREQRQNMLTKIQNYFSELSQSLEGGELNLRYQKESAIFDEYLRKYEIVRNGE